ncbi:MAG: oligopeptide transporter, OPT family, partial [Thermoplasmata archaeon]|nr:oligopeptide transporter, OPT family [Thermoplasmata archaeon]
VIAVAIMRPLKGSILETNLTKAMAVTGEALAAGVIFTFPALLVLYQFTDGQAGWENLMDHIPEMIIGAFIGGILGILLTIPLRKVMIIDLNLPYPEGVASAEVLITTEKGGKGMNYIAGALGLGAMFKLASTSFGLNIWHEKLEGTVGEGIRPYAGINLSPALLGVGYILGIHIAKLVFIGGVIGWIILNPIVGAVKGYPEPGVEGVYGIWQSDIMYIGIGAITTGGIYTLIKLRKPIVEGIKKSIGGIKGAGGTGGKIIRTEYDLPWKLWYFIAIAIAMFAMYWWITNSPVVTAISVPVLLIAAFFFTAVAGYLAGIIGSSNNPISGVTVTTLLFTAILLAAIGAEKNMGMTATIIVGAVVCCSAAIAGDSMQEL